MKVKLGNYFNQFKESHITNKLFIGLLVVFVIFSSFIAINLNREIIPDEPAHFILSLQFSKSLGIPADTPETYHLGPIGHSPYLFYWINGRLLNILDFLIEDPGSYKQLVLLRMMSVMYSTVTLIISFFFTKEFIKNEWWQFLPSFFLANTLMFIFLSGGINYDNLVNLCSFGSLLFLLRIFKGKSYLTNSLLWVIFSLLGTLTKITVLPLVLITFICWIIFSFKNKGVITSVKILNKKNILLAMVFFVLVILNFNIYGMNLIKFHALTPECIQVLSEDQCNLSPFVQRAKELHLPEKLTIRSIIEEGYPDPVEYVLDYWFEAMMVRIFGFFGHKHFFPDLIITFYRLFFIWIGFVIIRNWKKPSFVILSLWSIVIFYFLVLLATHYNLEMVSGFKHVAIQGRYLFPVIGIIYGLSAFYLSEIRNNFIRKLSYVLALTIFMVGGPLMFLVNYSLVFRNWLITH